MDLSQFRHKPKWLSRSLLSIESKQFYLERKLLKNAKLYTICIEGRCPNRADCLSRGIVTFLILGPICTRKCSFCAVNTGHPTFPDLDEPIRIAKHIANLTQIYKLNFIVITSVTRDDLFDGGARYFTTVLTEIRKCCPNLGIELLIPDFSGNISALTTVVRAQPEVLSHNLDTVPRLYNRIKPEANYQRSLNLLKQAKEMSFSLITKSSLMLGLGETEEEIFQVMAELRSVNCDILTLGQYLSPGPQYYPVIKFISPKIFDLYKAKAKSIGFKAVAAGPLVRSSFQAEILYHKTLALKNFIF